MADNQRVIDIWRRELRKASAVSSSSSDREDINDAYRWRWLKAMAAHLELARRMTIPEHILSYLFVELTAMDYDPDQAERAETWMKFGDWTFRGNDPILQLSDFTPSEDQFRKAYEAARARVVKNEPYQAPERKTGSLTANERKAFAHWIVLDKEPRWRFTLSLPWVDEHRSLAQTPEGRLWWDTHRARYIAAWKAGATYAA